MSAIESTRLAEGLQNQFNFERYSADVYYALASALDTANLTGFSAYMHKRADEERGHARRFSDYMADRNTRPELRAIEAVEIEIADGALFIGEDAFRAALAHENKVTARIDALFAMARAEGDAATEVFLQWFVSEQVEEERTLEEIITRFEMGRGNGAAILDIDREMRGD